MLRKDYCEKNKPIIPSIYPALPRPDEPRVQPRYEPPRGQDRRSPARSQSLEQSVSRRHIDISMLSAPQPQQPQASNRPLLRPAKPMQFKSDMAHADRIDKNMAAWPAHANFPPQIGAEALRQAESNYAKAKMHKISIDMLDPDQQSHELVQQINQGIDKINQETFRQELDKGIKKELSRHKSPLPRPQHNFDFVVDPFSQLEIQNDGVQRDLDQLDQIERSLRYEQPMFVPYADRQENNPNVINTAHFAYGATQRRTPTKRKRAKPRSMDSDDEYLNKRGFNHEYFQSVQHRKDFPPLPIKPAKPYEFIKQELQQPQVNEYITFDFNKQNPVQIKQVIQPPEAQNAPQAQGHFQFSAQPSVWSASPPPVQRQQSIHTYNIDSYEDSMLRQNIERFHALHQDNAIEPDEFDNRPTFSELQRALDDSAEQQAARLDRMERHLDDLKNKIFEKQQKAAHKRVEEIKKFHISPLTSGDETMRTATPTELNPRQQRPKPKLATVVERFDEGSDSDHSDEIPYYDYRQQRNKMASPKKISSTDHIKMDQNEQVTFKKDDFFRMELGTPQQNQILQKRLLVEEQDKHIKQQELMLEILKNKPNSSNPPSHHEDEEQKLRIHVFENNVKMMREDQEQKLKELARSTELSTHYKPTMEMPDIYEYVDYKVPHTHASLETKNIKTAIDTFNPDKDPSQDFADTWRNILSYTEDLKLDEKAYKKILRTVIQGSANRVLYDMNKDEKPLKSILQTLGDLYSTRRTIINDMQDVNNFKRKSGESIHTAMQRAKVLTERVKHLWPTSTWISTKRTEMLLSILKQIITPKTRKYIEGEEMKYWKTGTTLEYTAMLDLVDTYESVNNEIPHSEVKLVINVCTSAPLSNDNETPINTSNPQKELEMMKQTVKKLEREVKTLAAEPQKMDTSSPTETKEQIKKGPNKRKFETEKKHNQNVPKHNFKRHKGRSPERSSPPVSPPRMTSPGHPPHMSMGPDDIVRYNPPQNPFQRLMDNSSTYSFQNQWNLANNPNLPNNPYHKKATPEEFERAKQQYEARQAQQQFAQQAQHQRPQHYNNNSRGRTSPRNYDNRNRPWPPGAPNRANAPQNDFGAKYNNPNYNNTFVDKNTLAGYQGPANRGGYRGRGRNNNYRNETPSQRAQRLKEYFCPDCKIHHKITNFCPNTGNPTNVDEIDQHSLNLQGSPQTLPGRAHAQ